MLVSVPILKFKLGLSIGHPSKFNWFTYDRAYCRLVLLWQARK